MFAASSRQRLCVLGVASWAVAAPAFGSELQRLLPSDGHQLQHYGTSVALGDSLAVVGSRSDQDLGGYSGSAYLYKLDHSGSWQESQKLFGSDSGGGDLFGSAAAINGDRLLIGADGFQGGGAAYLFEPNPQGAWEEVAKLQADDRATDDYFGAAVALERDVAVVEAPLDDDPTLSGSVYVSSRDGLGPWTQTAHLRAPDANGGEWFGRSVSVSGGAIVVGAHSDSAPGLSYHGSAYVFEQDALGSWGLATKLLSSDLQAFQGFGASVAVEGDTILVGAQFDNEFGAQSGSVYVFERSVLGGWAEVQKITADDAHASAQFGVSVALNGPWAVVGATGDSPAGEDAGVVYAVRRSAQGDWRQHSMWLRSDTGTQDGLGFAVAVHGNAILAGAPGADALGPYGGSAYVFVTPEPSALLLVIFATASAVFLGRPSRAL